jgi:hypothetical protein
MRRFSGAVVIEADATTHSTSRLIRAAGGIETTCPADNA